MLVSDGVGGAVVTWRDLRGVTPSIYAQHLLSTGALDPAWPSNGRTFDGTSGAELLSQLVSDGAGGIDLAWEHGHANGLYTDDVDGTRIAYNWEYLVTVPARAFTGYAYEVTTDADSSTTGIPWEDFMVEADLTSGALFYGSGIDSGYSVDNIPPVMPRPFAATYLSGTAHLHWGPNFGPDLAGYRLYRGTSSTFIPGHGNLVVAQSDTGDTDVAGGPHAYKLSAVDLHGKESPYAYVDPTGLVGVPPTPAVFALAPVRPNPAPGGRLIVGFSLPDAAPARLELFNVNGRRAGIREVGALGTGSHAIDLAAGHPLAPGLYLVRLTQHGRAQITRVTVLD